MFRGTLAALAVSIAAVAPAFSAEAPAEIKLGTLYASSGRYASISMPVHSALKLWIDQKNADGGVLCQGVRQEDPGQAGRL